MKVTPSHETTAPFFLSCRMCPFLIDCHGLTCLGSGLPCGQVTKSVRIQPHFNSWCTHTWHIPARWSGSPYKCQYKLTGGPKHSLWYLFFLVFCTILLQWGFRPISVTKLLKFHWFLQRLRWDLLKSLMLCLAPLLLQSETCAEPPVCLSEG